MEITITAPHRTIGRGGNGITMINVLFVCLGNICRSPMAEFIFKNMVSKRGLAASFHIESAATDSYNERCGERLYGDAQRELKRNGIPFTDRCSRALRPADYGRFDHILCMDKKNISAVLRIFGGDPEGKVKKLLDYTDHPRDIADPWYVGRFDVTFDEITEGCSCFLDHLIQSGEIDS